MSVGLRWLGASRTFPPDGKLVLLDGLDACWALQYDHKGCKSAPSRVFHLLRPLDRRFSTLLNFQLVSG